MEAHEQRLEGPVLEEYRMAVKKSYVPLYVTRKWWCDADYKVNKVRDGWERYHAMKNKLHIPTRPLLGSMHRPIMVWTAIRLKWAGLYFRRKRWKVASTITNKLRP